ncbi:MAG: hypothetical protein ACI9WU_003779 [Myxococcota bacterium]|jgi:hypothetical protein
MAMRALTVLRSGFLVWAALLVLQGCGGEPQVLEEATAADGGDQTTGISSDTTGGDGQDSGDTGANGGDDGTGDSGDTGPSGSCSVAADCVGVVWLSPCQKPICDDGTCAVGPGADGVPCDDGDDCLLKRTCSSGTCQGGEPLPCDDGNLCTADGCDSDVGCVHVPFSGGCDDGNPCTLADHCVDAACAAGSSVCLCQSDAECDQWQDDDQCNGELKCLAGVCQVAPGSKPDCGTGVAGPCHVFGCDKDTGQCTTIPVQDGTACTDGNVCTLGDSCVQGACIGGGKACPCDDDIGCLIYDDGNLCNGVRACQGGQCEEDPATIISCATDNPCAAGACDPKSGQCAADPTEGAPCDDGDLCTVGDTCVGGVCTAESKGCDDGNPCTHDGCDDTGACAFSANTEPCDDGDECTANDFCTEGACQGFDDICSCTVPADCAAFEDDDPCNGVLTCLDGKCAADPASVVVCDSTGNTDCLVSKCAPGIGACQLVPVDDGTPCFDGDPCTDGETCQAGQCGGNLLGCNCQAASQLQCGQNTLWASDAFGSTNVVDAWACSPGDYSGAEFAWPFQTTTAKKVTVWLQDEETSTDIFVVQDDGTGCKPSGCIAHHPAKVTWVAQPDVLYYVVVDGKNGVAGKFKVDVDCTAGAELNCGDGADNDDDGSIDCLDDDCAADEACAPSENCFNGIDDDDDGQLDCADPSCINAEVCDTVCTPGGNVYCGFSQVWQTDGSAVNDVSDYGCAFQPYDGPEFVYAYNALHTGSVTVQLLSSFPGHSIFVMQDQGGGCNGASCVMSGTEEVTFFASAGLTYFVAIDGANGASGDYHMKVVCQ